jgi:hypothetical protein
MKKQIGNLISLALLALLCASVINAGPDCENLKGTGHTFAIGPATFQGTARMGIGGRQADAAVTTNLLGPPTASEDGTLHAATSHTFVFNDGRTFTTIDRAVLSPTDIPGIYRLNTIAAISAGSGDYAAACGQLSIHGTINLITGEVIWRFTGRVCQCG